MSIEETLKGQNTNLTDWSDCDEDILIDCVTKESEVTNNDETNKRELANPNEANECELSNYNETNESGLQNPDETNECELKNHNETNESELQNPEETNEYELKNHNETDESELKNPEETNECELQNPNEINESELQNPDETNEYELQNPNETNESELQIPDETNGCELQNPDKTNEYELQNPNETNESGLQNPDETNEYELQNPNETNESGLQNPDETNECELKNHNETNKSELQNPYDTNEKELTNPTKTNKSEIANDDINEIKLTSPDEINESEIKNNAETNKRELTKPNKRNESELQNESELASPDETNESRHPNHHETIKKKLYIYLFGETNDGDCESEEIVGNVQAIATSNISDNDAADTLIDNDIVGSNKSECYEDDIPLNFLQSMLSKPDEINGGILPKSDETNKIEVTKSDETNERVFTNCNEINESEVTNPITTNEGKTSIHDEINESEIINPVEVNGNKLTKHNHAKECDDTNHSELTATDHTTETKQHVYTKADDVQEMVQNKHTVSTVDVADTFTDNFDSDNIETVNLINVNYEKSDEDDISLIHLRSKLRGSAKSSGKSVNKVGNASKVITRPKTRLATSNKVSSKCNGHTGQNNMSFSKCEEENILRDKGKSSEQDQTSSDLGINSDDDPLYKVTKREVVSTDSGTPPYFETDSDSNESFMHKISKNARKVEMKTRIKKNKQKRVNAIAKDGIETAITVSKKEAKHLGMIKLIHINKLDALLASNGLVRFKIPADGNCFFQAVNSNFFNKTLQNLRNDLCYHLQENVSHYVQFLNTGDVSDAEKESIFSQELAVLQVDGQWSNSMADILPLAVCNLYQRSITIYSSKPHCPILNIVPDLLFFEQEETNTIKLAYIAIPGYEHYDSCVALDTLKSNPDNSVKTSTLSTADLDHTPPKRARKGTTEQEMSNISPIVTPRKAAKFSSPRKKQSSRKRVATPDMWKKNIRKRLRLTGKAYKSIKGNNIEARSVKSVDCSKCRYKCSSNFDEPTRKQMFNIYWGLESFDRKKDFICANVKEEPIKCKCKSHKKTKSRVFSFHINGKDVRVCKQFFMKTLDVGEKNIQHALENKVGGSFTSNDKRGRHIPHNKTPKHVEERVINHINSFPVLAPHYTRKDTQRKFLGADLNVKKMYQLYIEECETENINPVTVSKYRKIFCQNFNFSFHVPKKDQCHQCQIYDMLKSKGTLTDMEEKMYTEHINRKDRAREEKDKDKKTAKENNNTYAATFDLQAVLHTPCSKVSQIFYKRKLACYNLSTYSLADKKASCYTWNETEGARGSNEIATCLAIHLKALPSLITEVFLYSDNCSGQNRNQFMAGALLHTVARHPTLQVINQKFLERGHTEMEVDSMHAAIEYAKRNTAVHIPSHWDTIICMARRKNPYVIIPLKHWDFLNFKTFTTKFFKNMKTDITGKKVNWRKIRWIQYRKSEPNSLFIKEDFDQEDFCTVRVICTTRRGRATENPMDFQPEQRYERKLPISEAKKKDLLELCKTGIIPEEYVPYYKLLPSMKKSDNLPEPDIEDDIDTDQDSSDDL